MAKFPTLDSAYGNRAPKKNYHYYDRNFLGNLFAADPLSALSDYYSGNTNDDQAWNSMLFNQDVASNYNSNSEVYNAIGNSLTGVAKEYWDSLSDIEKEEFVFNDEFLTKVSGSRNLWGLLGDIKNIRTDKLIAQLQALNDEYDDRPVAPNREDIIDEIYGGENLEVNKYLEDLQKSVDRNTEMMQQQLNENQLAFDDYRSNLLSNQYQQNAQLMGQVGSEMSRARRNALEAGASAGLRMAENINTTLAMQNKQSQLSLETSNQLAQQLLNQRQASSGIRSNYNQMLNDADSEARHYKSEAVDKQLAYRKEDYEDRMSEWNAQFNGSKNAFANDFQSYLIDSGKVKDENPIKSKSVYN